MASLSSAMSLPTRHLLTAFLTGVVIFTAFMQVEPLAAQPKTFDHSIYDALLKQYVNEQGLVDYQGLKAKGADQLDAYLQTLAATNPAQLGEKERLAFWINAYNAYTLKLIVESYPVESIKETAGGAFIPRARSPWEAAFATVGGTDYTLNEIEHEIIRKAFDDPRIHFAVNCAAKSCPKLRPEAYVGARLDAQLDDQAWAFLHNEELNRIPAGEGAIALSKIFKWYGEDFGGSDAAIQAFLAPYFEGTVREKLEAGAYEIDFLDYDWSLNEQQRE